MKRIFGWLFAALLTLTFNANSALALDFFEVRFGLGTVSVDPDDTNKALKQINSGFDIDSITTLNLDLLAKFPLLPLGIGVRLERGQDSEDTVDSNNNGTDYDLKYTRYALLVNWRILNTLVYLGPIGTIGLHSGELETLVLSNTSTTDLDGDGPSITVGVEAGVILKKFLLGLEGGYQHIKFKSGTSGGAKADLSGPYIRALAGIRF